MTVDFNISRISEDYSESNEILSKGEIALWNAVITQALMDVSSKSKKSDARQAKYDAICWLTSMEADFHNICIMAGFDPDYVATKVRAAIQNDCKWRLPAGEGRRSKKRKETGEVSIRHRKRGRPRIHRPERDRGTPETQRYIAEALTLEPLDKYLETGVLEKEQHWCGLHLRWLYTLIYGAPGVKAVDPRHIPGLECKPDDTIWRAARQKEYREAMAELSKLGYANQLIATCIFNEPVRPLGQSTVNLKCGLSVLVGLWCRGGGQDAQNNNRRSDLAYHHCFADKSTETELARQHKQRKSNTR